MAAPMAALKIIRKMIQRGASTNIIENKPAVARSIRLTDKYTRKVSDKDATQIARKTVGKSPVPRERKVILRDNARGIGPSERKQISIKREVTKRKATKEELTKPKKVKVVTTPSKRVVKKSAPSKPGVEKTKAGGTVTRPKGKVNIKKFEKVKAEDIKDIVTRRMQPKRKVEDEKISDKLSGRHLTTLTAAQKKELALKMKNAKSNSKDKTREEVKSIKLERREKADIEAEKRGEELRSEMNRQYAESGKTHKYEMPGTRIGKTFRTNTKVENPLREPGNITEVEGRATRGIKNQAVGPLNIGGKKPDLKLSPAAKKRLVTKRINNYKLKKRK